MMLYLAWYLAVSLIWAVLWVTVPEAASALAMLFLGAIVIPGTIIEIREVRRLRGKAKR
jgi:hypothetical protein